MALREVTRAKGEAPPSLTDRMVRCTMMETGSGVEVWGEWNVQLADGRTVTRSVRCDSATEAQILALPNLQTALNLVMANTHPQVKP